MISYSSGKYESIFPHQLLTERDQSLSSISLYQLLEMIRVLRVGIFRRWIILIHAAGIIACGVNVQKDTRELTKLLLIPPS